MARQEKTRAAGGGGGGGGGGSSSDWPRPPLSRGGGGGGGVAFKLPPALAKAAPAPRRPMPGVPMAPVLPSSIMKPPKSRAREAHQLAVAGVRLAQQGQRAQAIIRFKRSIELDPTVATAHHDLGRLCIEAGRYEEAVAALCVALRLDANLASAHDHLAVALDYLGRVEEAMAAYQAAVKLEPERHGAQFRLGELYMVRGRRPEAASCFRAAATAAANMGTPEAKICEALAADADGDHDAAEAMLRAVIAANPEHGLAMLSMADVLVLSGRPNEAARFIERGIELRPDLLTAWQAYATNTKFTAADKPLIARIAANLERPNLTPLACQSVHYALGKAHDDIGEYEAAMRHFDAANAIRSKIARLNRTRLAQQTDRVISLTPKGYLERRRDLGVADDTPILIVGMPRSGTTLVEQIISNHPDVAAGGELPFWGQQNAAGLGIFGRDAKPEAVRKVAEDYLAVLREISPDAPHVTDKMPFNFGLLGLIRQVFPRAAIVHCRRHPVDTCLSNYVTGFEANIDFATHRDDLVFFYRIYQRMMAHWREVLPAERYFEIDYEELVTDPEPVTRRMIAACGLDWNDACLAPHQNQRRIMTASIWQARQPIYRSSVERWRRYEPWLGELRQLLPAANDEPASAAAAS
jgi:tetratricopeptide (TPR) repeat protein